MDGESWYILTLGNDALEGVRRLGCEVYQPILRTKRIHRRYKVSIDVEQVMFPGYAFVRGLVSWPRVLRVGGVYGVLQGARGEATFAPIALHPSQIEVIREMEKAPAEEVPELVELMFRAGDNVRLISGPFAGRQGEVLACDRRGNLEVSIEVLKRSASVRLPQQMAEAV